MVLHLDNTSSVFKDAARTMPATVQDDIIKSWSDVSGSSRHATSAAANGVLDLTAMAKPSVRWDALPGGGGLAVADDAVFTVVDGQGFEVYAVVQTTSTKTNMGPVGNWGSPTSEWALWARYFTGSVAVAAALNSFNPTGPSSTQINDGDPHLIHFRATTDNKLFVSVDGVDVVGPVNITSFSGDQSASIGIGNYQFDSTVTKYHGNLGEVRIYDTGLITEQRSTLNNQLISKWEI